MRPFWPGDTIRYVLDLLYQDVQNCFSIFLDLRSRKKDENMMSCYRLYVESTETLMGQRSKKRLLSLQKGKFTNMCGQNLFLIIINSKGSK